ncbi:MAG TPA: hypothetical protein ENJ95_15300 [Bacteroidetes bacterium]|nr:hypothetical protein [Bacteroidota bacterium]
MKKLLSPQSASLQSSVHSGVTLGQRATPSQNNFGAAQSSKPDNLSDKESIPTTSSNTKAKSNDGGYIWIV